MVLIYSFKVLSRSIKAILPILVFVFWSILNSIISFWSKAPQILFAFISFHTNVVLYNPWGLSHMSPDAVFTLPLPQHTSFLENSDFPESSISFQWLKFPLLKQKGQSFSLHSVSSFTQITVHHTHLTLFKEKEIYKQYLPFTICNVYYLPFFAHSRLSPYLIH